jgi:hypothetical protein
MNSDWMEKQLWSPDAEGELVKQWLQLLLKQVRTLLV